MLQAIYSILFLLLTVDVADRDSVSVVDSPDVGTAIALASPPDPSECHLTVSSTGTSIFHYDCTGACLSEEVDCAGLAVEGIFYCECDGVILPGVCSGEFDSELQAPGVICYQAGCVGGETCEGNTGLDVPSRPACICVE